MFMHHSCCAGCSLSYVGFYAVDFLCCSIFPVKKYLRTTRSVVIHVSLVFQKERDRLPTSFSQGRFVSFRGSKSVSHGDFL